MKSVRWSYRIYNICRLGSKTASPSHQKKKKSSVCLFSSVNSPRTSMLYRIIFHYPYCKHQKKTGILVCTSQRIYNHQYKRSMSSNIRFNLQQLYNTRQICNADSKLHRIVFYDSHYLRMTNIRMMYLLLWEQSPWLHTTWPNHIESLATHSNRHMQQQREMCKTRQLTSISVSIYMKSRHILSNVTWFAANLFNARFESPQERPPPRTLDGGATMIRAK